MRLGMSDEVDVLLPSGKQKSSGSCGTEDVHSAAVETNESAHVSMIGNEANSRSACVTSPANHDPLKSCFGPFHGSLLIKPSGDLGHTALCGAFSKNLSEMKSSLRL